MNQKRGSEKKKRTISVRAANNTEKKLIRSFMVCRVIDISVQGTNQRIGPVGSVQFSLSGKHLNIGTPFIRRKLGSGGFCSGVGDMPTFDNTVRPFGHLDAMLETKCKLVAGLWACAECMGQ